MVSTTVIVGKLPELLVVVVEMTLGTVRVGMTLEEEMLVVRVEGRTRVGKGMSGN